MAALTSLTSDQLNLIKNFILYTSFIEKIIIYLLYSFHIPANASSCISSFHFLPCSPKMQLDSLSLKMKRVYNSLKTFFQIIIHSYNHRLCNCYSKLCPVLITALRAVPVARTDGFLLGHYNKNENTLIYEGLWICSPFNLCILLILFTTTHGNVFLQS